MGDQLTFYILKQLNFINDDAQKWLGRIVKEYDTPFANSVPQDPVKYLPKSDHVFQTVISDASTLLKSSTSHKFKSVLASVLGGSYGTSSSREANITTKRLTRWRIRNDEDILANLLQDPDVKAKLDNWLTVMGKPVYFVVGLLVAEDPDTLTKTTSSSSIGVSVEIPVIDIATAAAGVPLPLGLGGIEFGKDKKKSSDVHLQGKSSGNQIFAMEYKILKRRVFSLSGRIEDKGYGPTFDSAPGSCPVNESGTIRKAVRYDNRKPQPLPRRRHNAVPSSQPLASRSSDHMLNDILPSRITNPLSQGSHYAGDAHFQVAVPQAASVSNLLDEARDEESASDDHIESLVIEDESLWRSTDFRRADVRAAIDKKLDQTAATIPLQHPHHDEVHNLSTAIEPNSKEDAMKNAYDAQALLREVYPDASEQYYLEDLDTAQYFSVMSTKGAKTGCSVDYGEMGDMNFVFDDSFDV